MKLEISNLSTDIKYRAEEYLDSAYSRLITVHLKISDTENELNLTDVPLLDLIEIIQRMLTRYILTADDQIAFLWDSGERIAMTKGAADEIWLTPIVGGKQFKSSKQEMLGIVLALNENVASVIAGMAGSGLKAGDVIMDDMTRYIVNEMLQLKRQAQGRAG